MCPPKKGHLELSSTASCTRVSVHKFNVFKCIATDVVVVKGKLPQGVSEAVILSYFRKNPLVYRVNGYDIKDLKTNKIFHFNPDERSVNIGEVNFELFGQCSGHLKKQGNTDVLILGSQAVKENIS